MIHIEIDTKNGKVEVFDMSVDVEDCAQLCSELTIGISRIFNGLFRDYPADAIAFENMMKMAFDKKKGCTNMIFRPHKLEKPVKTSVKNPREENKIFNELKSKIEKFAKENEDK